LLKVTYHQVGVARNGEGVDTVGDDTGWEDSPGAPGLVPQAPGLQGSGVAPPVLVSVKLRPIHACVHNSSVVRLLKGLTYVK
jgi:hypothetical protein